MYLLSHLFRKINILQGFTERNSRKLSISFRITSLLFTVSFNEPLILVSIPFGHIFRLIVVTAAMFLHVCH